MSDSAEEPDRDAIDIRRLLEVTRKRDEQGEESLTAEERELLERWTRVARRMANDLAKSLHGREEITDLGMAMYEVLPEDLQEKWGELTPAAFALLAMVFPEQLPDAARDVLAEQGPEWPQRSSDGALRRGRRSACSPPQARPSL
jgi:hypothetical protein